jgi:PIN domain nuclease of toxin-antitoxin system
LVTDTHPLLHYFSKSRRKLSRRARLAFDATTNGDVTIYVPVYVLIETSQLRSRGKIELSKPLREWFSDLFACDTFILAPLDATVAYRYDESSFTSDAADAMIVAPASALDLPLITNDSHIHAARTCTLYWD